MTEKDLDQLSEAVVIAMDKTISPLMNRLLTVMESQQRRIEELERRVEERRDG